MNSRKLGGNALSIKTSSSTASSPTTSTIDPEDEDVTMVDSLPPSKPLTVSIPKNIANSSHRKPTLSEILANTAPPPWTLTSFMAFLSQNHCLENLEFTMDASRYRKHYSKMVNRHPGSPISPLSDECTYVLMLWRRLIDAYIRESGPREVNLPADVRDTLLNLSDSYTPPHPSALDEAVSKIYELMEESVLVSFLNSACPQSAYPQSAYPASTGHASHDSSFDRSHTRSYDERTLFHRGQPHHVPAHQRASAPSSLANTFMHPRPFSHSRFNSQPASTTSASSNSARITSGYGSGSEALTDDSGSGSPSGLSDPLTPPGTPPMSDYPMADYHQAYYETGSGTTSGTPSPRTSRGEHNGLANATRDSWKRVSSKLWPKKRSGGALREEDGVVEGGLF
ncbi:regulator of G protein signaling superfamily [Aaosphaeria arxii CBS 175.79]|uniref:Regulator of G protein signaling superfamily n=1 Tax=Aaosphaeria arxii CBS 175.79 TaxID=1450172 RepID=A0A6A5XLU3_9PLEO|nr:regulator of G protein signaling superfamily [Aaosphaeria arxii CBS 175.79]KAF2013787.1 regulator of G protein signaling superfamily [Aaosphaeria arxii CBS 175.79]